MPKPTSPPGSPGPTTPPRSRPCRSAPGGRRTPTCCRPRCSPASTPTRSPRAGGSPGPARRRPQPGAGRARAQPGHRRSWSPDRPPTPTATPSPIGELTDLTVDPHKRRAGHGSRLLQAGVDTLVADRFTRAVTWLPAADDAPRAFLTEAGWGTGRRPPHPRPARRRQHHRQAGAPAHGPGRLSVWPPRRPRRPDRPRRHRRRGGHRRLRHLLRRDLRGEPAWTSGRPARCRCWCSPAPRSSRWSA